MDFFSALHFGPLFSPTIHFNRFGLLFSPTITTFSNNISSQDSSLFIAHYSVFEWIWSQKSSFSSDNTQIKSIRLAQLCLSQASIYKSSDIQLNHKITTNILWDRHHSRQPHYYYYYLLLQKDLINRWLDHLLDLDHNWQPITL